MDTIGGRLEFLLKHLKWTNYKLAKIGNFSKTSVTNWVTGKTKPDSSKVEVIVMVTGVNKEWLLTGEGPMMKPVDPNLDLEPVIPVLKTKSQQKLPDTEPYLITRNGMKYYEKAPGRYMLRVPLVPYDAYARFSNDLDLQLDRDGWDEVEFEVNVIGRGNYMAFAVRGDSMDDGTKKGISQGDILLVRELERVYWKEGVRFTKYPFWVIAFDNSILVKEIIHQNIATGDIVCHSLNQSPEYRDFTVNLEDVQRLFNVIKVKVPDREF